MVYNQKPVQYQHKKGIRENTTIGEQSLGRDRKSGGHRPEKKTFPYGLNSEGSSYVRGGTLGLGEARYDREDTREIPQCEHGTIKRHSKLYMEIGSKEKEYSGGSIKKGGKLCPEDIQNERK